MSIVDIDEPAVNANRPAPSMSDPAIALVTAVGRYRVAFHAEHAFAGGLVERVVGILRSVEDPVPAVQVERWEPWPDRLTTALGPDHPDTLTTRNNLASSYWSAGRTNEAITLNEQVLADSQRILGPDHPDTLNTRHNLDQMRSELNTP